ncbi:MAG TPA: hypothetical protein VEK07_10555 [Polyangiaceae bacterium]|nr:hypothetical protein [Polyangiaceae bacterium]
MRTTLCTAAAAAILALVSAPARAQSDAQDRATARALAQQGSDALDAKDYAKAEDAFRRADALFHAPTLVLGLARAQAAEGKFVEAWEGYNRIILENVTSPPVFAKALDDAKREISSVEGRRSRVTVIVGGSSSPRVTVDDAPLKTAALGVQFFINPGTHTVQASADGFNPATRTFAVAEGKSETVTVTLEPAAAAAPGSAASPAVAPGPAGAAPGTSAAGAPAAGASAPGGPAAAQSAAPGAEAGASKPSHAPAVAALVVGGVGLVAGIATGLIAIGDHSHLESECGHDTCSTQQSQSDLSHYHTVGLVSTVGFVVAGVGAATGIALWFVESGGSHSAPASASVSPYIGIGSVGAVGRF